MATKEIYLCLRHKKKQKFSGTNRHIQAKIKFEKNAHFDGKLI